MNRLLLIFLTIHIIGVFYFQGETVIEDKKSLFKNGFIYFLIAAIFTGFFTNKKLMYYSFGFSALHFFFCIIKFCIYIFCAKRKNGKLNKFLKRDINIGKIFIFEQIISLLVIFLFSYFVNKNTGQIQLYDFFHFIKISKIEFLKITLMVLLVLNPVNIAFRNIFNHTKPLTESKDFTKLPNTGKLIGNLERVLVLMFLLLNQYTAIGLIFTAKSITRYDKISKDQNFAEYYLLGTLFSLLSTLVIFILVKNI